MHIYHINNYLGESPPKSYLLDAAGLTGRRAIHQYGPINPCHRRIMDNLGSVLVNESTTIDVSNINYLNYQASTQNMPAGNHFIQLSSTKKIE